MKILGIGNAIVDVICKVDENFILKNALTKGTMKLIFDQNEFEALLANLKIEKTISGGSVANSIVGLSQLGNKVGFAGKVSDDKLGSKYEEGLKKVLAAIGSDVDESKVKSLVASLKDVDIDKELENAVVASAAPAASGNAGAEGSEAKAEEAPKEEPKEASAAGLSALFG